MSVQVSLGGQNYTIPEDDELGWSDLTNYLVALSGAQLGSTDAKSYRVATATPVAVAAASDYAVGVNVAASSSVVLPSGTNGQIFVIYDASGNARTYPISISGTGGQEINGRATYVIRSNFGVVQLQYVTNEWKVIGERQTVGDQNETNLSVVDASIAASNTAVTVSNLQSCTVTYTGVMAEFTVIAGTKAMKCSCEHNSAIVNSSSDPDSMFLATDAGTGIVVSKSATSSVLTFKNRLGTSASFLIKFTNGSVVSATAWS